MQGDTSFFNSLAIQWRVIRALLMREILTRYGRHNIGFFWLFVEPMLFCCGVVLIRKLFIHESARGLPVVEFVMTGYSSILLWRNCGSRCGLAISTNTSLLYHHNVRVIDLVASRIILEIAGCAIAFLVMTVLFVAIGLISPPEDLWLVMIGYILSAWIAASLGILIVGLSESSELFERLWHPAMYFMLPISGFGFMVDWLPVKIQKLALLVPMVNALEIMRQGFFGSKVRCHYELHGLIGFCLVATLVGLLLLNFFARRVEPE